MDQLQQLGTDIGSVVGPTFQTYAPLLVAQQDEIKSLKKEEHSYGPHSRQKLDIYYATEVKHSPQQVLVFFYGGGLVNGNKSDPQYANGTTFANLAYFFVKQFGFTVVIPDYRLLSHGAQYPSGGEDVALALEWVRGTLSQKQGFSSMNLNLMGNSAGGVHLATYLLDPIFKGFRAKILPAANNKNSVRLHKVIFLSVPFHFKDAHPRRQSTLQTYFLGAQSAKSPLGLLQAAQLQENGLDLTGVKFAVINDTLDPEDEILTPRKDFIDQWRAEDPPIVMSMIEGHNHISPVLAVGTGIRREEAWAFDVGRFCVED